MTDEEVLTHFDQEDGVVSGINVTSFVCTEIVETIHEDDDIPCGWRLAVPKDADEAKTEQQMTALRQHVLGQHEIS